MKLRIDKLTGNALNWAVATFAGMLISRESPVVIVTGVFFGTRSVTFAPETNPEHAWPIILKYNISMLWRDGTAAGTNEPYWWSCVGGDCTDEETLGSCGDSPLQAAMRAFVLFKVEEAAGEDSDDIYDIEVPDAVASADADTAQKNAKRVARRISKEMSSTRKPSLDFCS